jgi:hypothetical protein
MNLSHQNSYEPESDSSSDTRLVGVKEEPQETDMTLGLNHSKPPAASYDLATDTQTEMESKQPGYGRHAFADNRPKPTPWKPRTATTDGSLTLPYAVDDQYCLSNRHSTKRKLHNMSSAMTYQALIPQRKKRKVITSQKRDVLPNIHQQLRAAVDADVERGESKSEYLISYRIS